MNIEEIRHLKHTEPFQPFDIVMKDGRMVRVERPSAVALSTTGKTVAVYEPFAPAPTFLSVGHMDDLHISASRKKK